jgi:hypothetical protein
MRIPKMTSDFNSSSVKIMYILLEYLAEINQ